ncbi:nectin-2-like isoform X2 [Anolis sagrei]|uniref:nectin-2-like isoform X2 n=1 Tax=Anolis sagrei TaxID=38937 RepID=UPI003522C90C
MGPLGSLLAALLGLLLLLPGSLGQTVRVRDEVTGFLGQEAVLPCHFVKAAPDIKVSQVTWMKEASGRKQNVAVYHPEHGPSFPMDREGTRIRFRTPSLEDTTLVIGPLRLDDEGTYFCEFATYPGGNQDGVTHLIVLAKPTNTAEAQEVKVSSLEQPVATCTSAHGKPPARITWQSSLGGNASVSEVTNADGTVTVTSHYRLVPSKEANGQRITCVVEHKALPQPEALPVTLSILYPPEVSIVGYDDNWYLSRNEAMLTCRADGNPMPTEFIWSTSSGPLPKTVTVQGGNLLVQNVDASVNTTFICQATNRVGQVATEQVIFVRDRPARRQSGGAGALAGSIVGGLLAVAILGAILTVFLLRRRRRQREQRGGKGSYDPKTRVFGNGTAPPPARDFAELDRPLKAAPGRRRDEDEEDDYEDEDEREEQRPPPYGYAGHHHHRFEDEDQLGPMLRLGPALHGYEYDDMESQHDGSIISKTAVYV